MSENSVVADPDGGAIDSCGLTACVPLPVSASVSFCAFALMTSVPACSPSADGLNCAVTEQLVPLCRKPFTAQVVLHGNSWRFVSVMLPMATWFAAVFESATTSVVLEVVPTVVAGNVVLFQVTVNVEG